MTTKKSRLFQYYCRKYSILVGVSSQCSLNENSLFVSTVIIYSLSSNEKSRLRGMADKFAIEEILQAAGVTSLDEPSDAFNAKGKPFRRHGIVLHMAINYQNAESTLLGTG